MIPGQPTPRDQSRLIAIAGPLRGEVLLLTGTEVTIGRDPSNAICLSDLALSRRHCAITTAPAPRIRDLGSSNGTFVNGMQIADHALVEGDRIQLGESVFLFFTKPPASGNLHFTIAPEQPGALTTRLRLEEARYLQGNERDAAAGSARTEQALRALLRLSTTVTSARKEEDVHRCLLDLLADAVRADHFAIVAENAGVPIVENARRKEGAGDLEINTPVLREALHERTGVLTSGGPSILCVPLAIRDRVFGAIYLAAAAAGAFEEHDLQLVAAIAAVAAAAVDNARHVAWLESEAERLQSDLALTHNLVGRSPKMQRVYDVVAKVARTDTTVLVTGETGTGKELVARAVHLNSPRARRPFVAINCAALTETLLETELFGHERGAFTNAVAQKKGKLEIADGGTVFLDEVAELAPALQSKLLRVLQEHEFERVGGTRTVAIDVRVISATNRVLAEEVAARRFREDLYHRLNVVNISMPPLRERREDIPALANHFIARFASKVKRHLRGLSPRALRYLTAYDWPGNVRELENAIERAVVLGSSDEIIPEDLPESIVESAGARNAGSSRLHDAVRETKARAIREAYRQAHGSYTEAARILGVHPNYLHRLIRNLGIKAELEAEG